MIQVSAEAWLIVGPEDTARHTAAAAPGSRVRAVATCLRTEDRLVHFKVEAFDEAGAIGLGEHSRAVIDTRRLHTGAQRRRKEMQ